MIKMVLLAVCSIIIAFEPAWGAVYSWRDKGGVMHYTNDERDVPLEHRKKNNLEVFSWLDKKTGEIRYAIGKEEVPPEYRKQAGIEVYKYTDSKGEVHYAFDLEDIPKWYRNKAVKETEEALASAVVDTPEAPTPQRGSQVQPSAAQPNPFVEALKTYQKYKKIEGQQPPSQEKTNPFIEAIKRSRRLREQREQNR